jgi:predicted aconitase with swiveling domain
MAGQSPKAMIIRDISSLTGIGAVVMRVPTVTELDKDPTEIIETGDWVKVDADRGIVEITKKKAESSKPFSGLIQS